MKKLMCLLDDEQRMGFVGRRRGIKMDLTLYVKKNKSGVSLSLLVFSSSFERGPKASAMIGWKCLLNALSWTMNINPAVSTVEIRRKMAAEKIVVEPVTHEVVEELEK